jgi:dihydrofolate reductase
MAFGPPDLALFLHFVEEVRGCAGMVYGRGMYEAMRYWDEDHPGWDEDERAYAAVWRSKPKWVVSRSLKEVGPDSIGPGATLVAEDVEAAIGRLKGELEGEIGVAGPGLAQSLTDAGLIDEYRLYLHPVVLGQGKAFFAGARPRLRLAGSEVIAGDVIRLRYVPD